MSRDTPIGRRWFEEFTSDATQHHSLRIGDKSVAVPAYFKHLRRLRFPELHAEMVRRGSDQRHIGGNTGQSHSRSELPADHGTMLAELA